MPVSRPQDLPKGGGGRWPTLGWQAEQWGDLVVGWTTTPAVDCTPLYRGMPGDVCQCPHYGYVFSGRMRCVYPGTDRPDEVAEAGDAYFFPAGHVLVYDEPTEALEFNPAAALQVLMDHIERVAAAGNASA